MHILQGTPGRGSIMINIMLIPRLVTTPTRSSPPGLLWSASFQGEENMIWRGFFLHVFLFVWHKLADGQINLNIQRFIKQFILISYLTTYLWKRSMRNQGKDEFVEFLKLLSMAQRAADKDFDTSRVILKIYISMYWCSCSLVFENSVMSSMNTSFKFFQLHPKDRAAILHECLYCSSEFPNRPALLVTFIQLSICYSTSHMIYFI